MANDPTEKWARQLEEAMNEAYPIEKHKDTEVIKQETENIVNSDLSGLSYPYHTLGKAAAEAYESSELSNLECTIRASITRAFEETEDESMTCPHGEWNYLRDGWEAYREEN